jgi:hypothetical protein
MVFRSQTNDEIYEGAIGGGNIAKLLRGGDESKGVLNWPFERFGSRVKYRTYRTYFIPSSQIHRRRAWCRQDRLSRQESE